MQEVGAIRTILLILLITVGGCGSVAGQGMFLPSDENGSIVEFGHITNRYGSGFGMGMGLASGGFELGFAADFIDGDYVSSTAIGLFASLDGRRLGRISSPASLQITGGVVVDGSTFGLAFGPTAYVGTINPIGWVAYLHGGSMVLRSIESGEEGQLATNLGGSLGYRSSGAVIAVSYVAVFSEEVTTYSISLSLTFRKPRTPRFDDDF